MKFIPKMAEILDNHGKRKMLYHLRLMSDRQLIDCGYSPELLRDGVKAWPWRELPEDIAPLRFDQSLKLSTVSTKIEHTHKSTKKRIVTQQDAA